MHATRAPRIESKVVQKDRKACAGRKPQLTGDDEPPLLQWIRRPRIRMRLCAKIGFCDYWVHTNRWPDCADKVLYDFKAEARRFVTA